MTKRDDVERDVTPDDVVNPDHMIGDTKDEVETQETDPIDPAPDDRLSDDEWEADFREAADRE